MRRIPAQTSAQTPAQRLNGYKDFVDNKQSKDIRDTYNARQTQSAKHQSRGMYNSWQNQPGKQQGRGMDERRQASSTKQDRSIHSKWQGRDTDERQQAPSTKQDRSIRSKWQNQPEKHQSLDTGGRWQIPPGKNEHINRNLTPHSDITLNLLSQMEKETKLECETQVQLEKEKEKAKQQEIMQYLNDSYNTVLQQVTLHYTLLYEKVQSLYEKPLSLCAFSQVATYGNFAMLFTSMEEQKKLAEKINNAFAIHTSLYASDCTIVMNITIKNDGEYPTVYVKWNITNKPTEVCKYELEQSLSSDKKDDAENWTTIKTMHLGTNETIGIFAFESNDKHFQWGKLYKLRMRGFCSSNIICTPFSDSIILCPWVGFADSSIIKNNYIPTLLQWMPKGRSHNITRLYRGSSDGFDSNIFHMKCNKQGATLTVLETTSGYIFGAYTEISWCSRKLWKYDETAFLFLLKTSDSFVPQKFPIKTDEEKFASWSENDKGPCFGRTDICIVNNCDREMNSSQLASYACDRLTLADQTHFLVKEIEVYTIS